MRSTSRQSERAEQSAFKSVLGGTPSKYKNKQIIYSQGKTANTLFYIWGGDVMLTIRSKGHRPAVITVLGAGDFFGQSCIAGVPLRLCTATAIGPCLILAINKKEMTRILHRDKVTSRFFVSYLLSVIKEHQDHVVDLLVNSAERRLARVLLHLARLSANGGHVPKISQAVLAIMIGTTRSRTNFLMNRFRKRGFIRYNGGIKVNSSLRAKYFPH
jgi:CRP/FNR family cyclic AMP-dependent transcriptional regulator